MKRITEYPILYKKTSTGKIQQWRIWVEDEVIWTEYGQTNGKLQIAKETIKEGKNLGRANATTSITQAVLEAEATWTGKLKKGYVRDFGDAQDNKTDAVIEGGFTPMLAKSYDDHFKKIEYPVAAQPKLDGIRCVTTLKNKLWSRTRKPIISVPHIQAALEQANKYPELDGELYNHELKDNFEKITHIVAQKTEPDPEHKLVQYHIYDVPSPKPFLNRMTDLMLLDEEFKNHPFIKIVPTAIAHNVTELRHLYELWLEQGYEGLMVRNLRTGYEYKRTADLLKMKEFQDAEFRIVALEEGKAKLAGHCGAFVCVTADGTEFKAKMSGDTKMLKHYWENPMNYIGELLTVQYQGLTNKNNVPRFPVGLRIRNYE